MEQLKRIVIWGGVGTADQFGGELIKNKLIIERCNELGYKVVTLDTYQCRSRYRKLLLLLVRLMWHFIVHPHSTFVFSSAFKNFSPIVKLLNRLPYKYHLVYWVIGGNLAQRIKEGIYFVDDFKAFSLFIVEGMAMKKDLEALGLKNILYLPNFKKDNKYTFSLEKRIGNKIRFLFLSRIMKEKGCQYIIESVRQLNNEGLKDRYEVDFYGQIDPVYHHEFELACRELDNIHYCGVINLSDEKQYDNIVHYHYMLFPTYWEGEGFPGALADALKVGIPALVSDWNLNPEIITNGKTGYIFKTHSQESLVNCMRKALLVNNSEYEQMVTNCLEKSNDYKVENVLTPICLRFITTHFSSKKRCKNFLKRIPFIYFTRVHLFDTDYKLNSKKMKKNAFKSTYVIKKEMKYLSAYWHCPSDHYIRYGLYDKNLSEEKLLDYIPPFFYYNYYLPKSLNGLNEALYEDKLNLYYVFKKHGIPTPNVVAIVRNRKIFDLEGNLIDIQSSHMNFIQGKRYFFKPVSGKGGIGIKVYKPYKEDSLEDFLMSLSPDTLYIVQEALVQREDLNRINRSSVNTLRIVTKNESNHVRICGCALRMGRNGKEIDNNSQGGLSVNVDIDTGHFSDFATAEHGGGFYDRHPDSKFVFKGAFISDWNIVKENVVAYAKEFPSIKEIGWDIALTDNGVQAIEMNLGFGITHLQLVCGGMRRCLNIFPK